MKTTFDNSRIEIWSAKYINYPKIRDEKDKNVRIVQVERSGDANDYIVEVINREEAQEEQEEET